jgi:hypothetical protein
MTNYQNSKIYKLIDNTTNNVYIGSTTKQYLSQRLTQHKADYNRFLKGKQHFITSYDIIKNNDYDIILLEIVNVNTKDELVARERWWIENTDCINKRIEGRTRKEYWNHYQQKNKEIINEKHRNHYETVKEQRKEKCTCKCGSVFRIDTILRHERTKKHISYLEQSKP